MFTLFFRYVDTLRHLIAYAILIFCAPCFRHMLPADAAVFAIVDAADAARNAKAVIRLFFAVFRYYATHACHAIIRYAFFAAYLLLICAIR